MTRRDDHVVRAARAIGDLDSPFYDEERQRDVWNEASAVGFQFILITSLLTSTVTIWVVGRPALPYVQSALLLVGLASILAIVYAQRLGVAVASTRWSSWARIIPVAVVLVTLLAGLIRALETDLSASTLAGMVTGAAVVLLLVAIPAALKRRRGAAG